jgi:hypothetical protein
MFWYGLFEYDMVQCFGMVWLSMVWSMFWYGLFEYDMVQCFGMVWFSMVRLTMTW